MDACGLAIFHCSAIYFRFSWGTFGKVPRPFPSFDGKLEKTLCLDAHEGNGIADWPLVISVKFFLARGVPSRCQSYPWRFCEFIYF